MRPLSTSQKKAAVQILIDLLGATATRMEELLERASELRDELHDVETEALRCENKMWALKASIEALEATLVDT